MNPWGGEEQPTDLINEWQPGIQSWTCRYLSVFCIFPCALSCTMQSVWFISFKGVAPSVLGEPSIHQPLELHRSVVVFYVLFSITLIVYTMQSCSYSMECCVVPMKKMQSSGRTVYSFFFFQQNC